MRDEYTYAVSAFARRVARSLHIPARLLIPGEERRSVMRTKYRAKTRRRR